MIHERVTEPADGHGNGAGPGGGAGPGPGPVWRDQYPLVLGDGGQLAAGGPLAVPQNHLDSHAPQHALRHLPR